MNILKDFKLLIEYRRDPAQFLKRLAREQGGVAHVQLFGKEVYVVSDPQAVSYVLSENANNYLKGRTTQKLRIALGNGLITSEGEDWKKQNRLIRQNFTLSKIKALMPILNRNINEHLTEMDKLSEVNIQDSMQDLSLAFVGQALFGQKLEHKEKFINVAKVVMDYVVTLTRSLIPIHEYLPTKKTRQFRKVMCELDHEIYALIDQRIAEIKAGTEHSDLLCMLIDKDNIDEMSRTQVRDEIMTLLMAGHETITGVLTWSLIVLCERPEIQEELYQLSQEILTGDSFDSEKLSLFNFADQFLAEVMRVYPPVWVFMRENINEDNLNGAAIPKGSVVVLAPYITHHLSQFWDNPETFDPSRFKKQTDMFVRENGGLKYYPFGGGPRICIGAGLAMMEGKLILLKLINRYKFAFKNYEQQKINAGISYRATNNTQMLIRTR